MPSHLVVGAEDVAGLEWPHDDESHGLASVPVLSPPAADGGGSPQGRTPLEEERGRGAVTTAGSCDEPVWKKQTRPRPRPWSAA